MNKTELVKAIVENNSYNVTQKCAAEMIDTFCEKIVESVKKGEDVQLVGFGTFTASKRAARTGRNPQTGKEVKIPAMRTPKFKAGKAFKDAVKG